MGRSMTWPRDRTGVTGPPAVIGVVPGRDDESRSSRSGTDDVRRSTPSADAPGVHPDTGRSGLDQPSVVRRPGQDDEVGHGGAQVHRHRGAAVAQLCSDGHSLCMGASDDEDSPPGERAASFGRQLGGATLLIARHPRPHVQQLCLIDDGDALGEGTIGLGRVRTVRIAYDDSGQSTHGAGDVQPGSYEPVDHELPGQPRLAGDRPFIPCTSGAPGDHRPGFCHRHGTLTAFAG